MATESDGLKFTRRRIQKQMEQAEKEKKAKLYKRRMELAALGSRAMKQRNYAEGVACFQGYLKILEESKGAGPGGLVPSQFDRKAELSELVLLSGIYWDMTKIYDQSKSGNKYHEFVSYLEKFLLFSKGMPYEPVCRETMRKYLRNDKPVHSKEFREAYRRMTGSRCFVATSLVDVLDERTLPRLRRYRDRELRKSLGGRAFISLYYAVGPVLASGVDRLPDGARAWMAFWIDRFASKVARRK